MRRIPSIDTIERIGGIDRETAIKLRRLLDGRDDPTKYPRTKKWVESCYFEPRHLEQVIEACDELLDTCGVEAIRAEGEWDNYRQDVVAIYCNNGQSYDPTILYDYDREVFYVTSTGHWIETAERNGRYKFR